MISLCSPGSAAADGLKGVSLRGEVPVFLLVNSVRCTSQQLRRRQNFGVADAPPRVKRSGFTGLRYHRVYDTHG